MSHHRGMGLFDSVHTGTRCGQTKALGRSMADYTIGDAGMHLFPVPVEQTTFEEFLGGLEREPVADTFAVMMDTGGLLVVTETVLVDWVAHIGGVPAGHPVVTGLGLPAPRPLVVDELAARRQAATARTAAVGARDCAACTVIRTGGRDAYAAIRNDARAVARSEARTPARRRSAARIARRRDSRRRGA